MILYVVQWIDYDQPPPFGVFSTKKKAQEVAAARNKKFWGKHYTVLEYVLDSIADPYEG